MIYHYFNPETDFCLAFGKSSYSPPKNIIRFRDDLSLLPLWFADEDDCVLLPVGVPQDWQEDIRQALSVRASWMSLDEYWRQSAEADQLVPWGWNHQLERVWLSKSASRQQVDCDSIRKLSGRDFVVDVLTFLEENDCALPENFVMPSVLHSVGEVSEWLKMNPQSVLKMPWSSSGKGLLRIADGKIDGRGEQWCANALKRQGFLMGERWYEGKKLDFAMEFRSGGNDVSFVGFSLFETEDGRYKGNRMMSDEAILSYLSHFVPKHDLMRVARCLEKFFVQTVASFYQGYFGVDMMILSDEDEKRFSLHPCVEVNLRMNMGVVSHLLQMRYAEKESRGRFVVKSFPTAKTLADFNEEMTAAHPLHIKNGRIKQGYLVLTYIGCETQTLAYLLFE